MQDMYTPIPVPASLKEYKSFEFLQRDLRVTSASPSAGSLHGGQVRSSPCPLQSSCVVCWRVHATCRCAAAGVRRPVIDCCAQGCCFVRNKST